MDEHWHQDIASVGIRVEVTGSAGAYKATMTDIAPGRLTKGAGFVLDINEKWMPVMANPLAKVFKTSKEAIDFVCRLLNVRPEGR